MRGRVVDGCGGRVASMLLQAEEDVDALLNWAGCWGIRSEARDGLTSDDVLLVVQGEDDLGDMLKPLDRGVRGEEGVSDKEDEFLEWTELDCPAMAGAIGVITRSEAEVESQDDQVGGVSGILVRG